MDAVTTCLNQLSEVVIRSKQVKFSKRRCAALSSRCPILYSIIEKSSQGNKNLSSLKLLSNHLARASNVISIISNSNVVSMMIKSCAVELDEIIAEIDSLVQEMELDIGIELKNSLVMLELKYSAEKAEDSRELQILIAENNKRLDEIREFLSLEGAHFFLRQIMDMVLEPGQIGTDTIVSIIKKIEVSEDNDVRLRSIKDIIQESRQKGQSDSVIAQDVINTVSGMVQVKNSLEPPDPKIDIKDLAVGKVIGSGVFGTIYEGIWRSNAVALKALKNMEASESKMLMREVQVISTLRGCSNIISLFGYCVDKSSHAIVMELAQNGNLFDFIHHNNAYHEMDDEQKHNLITGIAHGVAIMHQVGIVHRELKSPNILLDSRMTPKIADFGLTGMGTKSLMSTLSKSAVLSISSTYWKAPEVLIGKKYTNKSDIFALGIIVWEILQGEMSFNGREHAAVSKLIIDGKKVQVNSEIDPVYKRIISECQNMDSDARPTALEVLQWLSDYATNDKEFVKVELVTAESSTGPQGQSSTSTSSRQVTVYSATKSQKKPVFSEKNVQGKMNSNATLEKRSGAPKMPVQKNVSLNLEVQRQPIMSEELSEGFHSANEINAKRKTSALFVGLLFLIRAALVVTLLVLSIIAKTLLPTVAISVALVFWLLVIFKSLRNYRGKIKNWVHIVFAVASVNKYRHNAIDPEKNIADKLMRLKFFLIDSYQLVILILSCIMWYKSFINSHFTGDLIISIIIAIIYSRVMLSPLFLLEL